MRPSLRSKKYGQAIELCVAEIDLILSGRESEIKAAYTSSFWDNAVENIFLVAFFGLFIFGIYQAYMSRRRFHNLGRGDQAMQNLMRDIQSMVGSIFTSCLHL